MQRRIIIRNGKKYIVNVPTWNDISWGDQVGSGEQPYFLPFISQQPTSITSLVGTTAIFVVVAGPSGPFDYLAYQWYFGGVPLTDTTQITGSLSPILYVNNISGINEGDYYVQVSNANGFITSSHVTLNIPSYDTWDTTPNNWEVETEKWELA